MPEVTATQQGDPLTFNFTRQAAYNDRLETDLALAGILRRYLRGDRWTQTEDGAVLYIDDSVDLTPTEQAAVLEAVKEA